MNNPPLTFGNISTILLRRKQLLATMAVLSAGIGYFCSVALPQFYTAVGGMIVQNGEPNVPELGMGIGTANTNPEGVVVTQVEVLRSVGLIENVIDKLHLVSRSELSGTTHLPPYLEAVWKGLSPLIDRLPRWPFPAESKTIEGTLEYMQKRLRVESTERSSVVTLQYPAGSSELAVAIIDTLMNAYLDSDLERRAAQIRQVNAWLTDRSKGLQKDADDADDKVRQFVETHPQLYEVMNSLPAAVQLNTLQTRLSEAQQELARQQALFETLSKGGYGADEVIGSKTIQMYKEREAQLVQQLAILGPLDPRRRDFQIAFNSVRAEILDEKVQIALSVRRNWDVAKVKVEAIEAAVQSAERREQVSSIDAAAVASLRAAAQAKKQLFLAFGSRAEQTRLAAAQLPSARILYEGSALPHHSITIPAVVVGGLSGVLLSGGLIVLLDALRGRVVCPLQIVSSTGLPVIASMPEMNRHRKPIPTFVTETVRAMWWNVLADASKGVVITVTSSDKGEGKTTMTAMMSRRIAADGGRVLVIDADLRQSGLGREFGTAPRVPLDAVLGGTAPLSEAIYHDVSGVDCFLPEGPVENPVAVFQSVAFRQLIENSKSLYDVVFLDTPPVLRVADALFLSKLSNHILFVVGAGSASTDSVNSAVARFSPEDRQKVIVILNRVAHGDLKAPDYFKGYGSPT